MWHLSYGGMSFLFPVDRSPCPGLSATVPQLLKHWEQVSHLVMNSCDTTTINVHSRVLKLHAMLTYFLTKPNSFIKCMWSTLCNTPKWFVAHIGETTDE